MINSKSNNPKLLEILPEGMSVGIKWLNSHGFNRQDADYYLRSGALVAIKRGLYCRPGVAIKWEGLVHSLAEMGFDVHIGGEQALVEQGVSHFISMSKVQTVHLFSAQILPKWLSHWQCNTADELFCLVVHRQTWLAELNAQFFSRRSYGLHDWMIRFAQAELAVFEYLFECKTEIEFQQMDRWFESLSSLSPTKLQHLLTLCPNVKTKRLFGWFTYRHNHAWAKHLDWDKVDIGKGKRSIIKGGSFDKRWQITVPRKMEVQDGSEQSIF